MRIIVLGSNHVSQTLAENLAGEDNDVVIIDDDADKLRDLQHRYDVQTIVGHGSYPDVLERAQASDADMLIAVSGNDEVNMLACQVAYSLFHIPIKIARIRQPNYLSHPELYCNESLPVDVIISPEQLVTDYLKRLVERPGTLQVLDFAEGKVQLVAVKAYYGGPLVGKPIALLNEKINELNANIAAIFRGDQLITMYDEFTVEVGDEVFFIANTSEITTMMGLLRRLEHVNKNVMIAGGGHIGCRLAHALEYDYHVKVIDQNVETTEKLAIELDKTIVLHGDAADKDLLLNENIEDVDVFCAVTNDDEANIMSCFQAKKLGAKHTMALVSNVSYIDVIEDNKIDIVISPQNATISSILAYIRRGDIANIHSLRRGAAEAIEIIAHGDNNTSRVVGKKIKDLSVSDEIRVGAIVREGKMIVPTKETDIQNKDHVILFLANKKRVKEVEKLFQVKVNFF